jgi:hypothetical protein
MMSVPRLSILIPCLGPAEQFEGSLVSVLQHRPADCEVALVHREAYDDPYELADEVRLIHAPECGSLVELVNAALPQLAGDVVHLLACGVEVDEGWTEPALRHFASAEVAAVSPLVLDAELRVAAAGVSYGCGGRRNLVGAGRPFSYDDASRWTIAGPTLLAGFYCRETLLALDGFSLRMGDTHADLDMALAIKELGRTTVFEPACQTRLTVEQDAASRRGFAAGRQAEQFYRQHGRRSSAVARWAVHPLAVAGDAVARLPGLDAVACLAGRALAWLETSPRTDYQDRLAAAAARLDDGETSTTLSLDAARTRREQATPMERRRAA